MAKKERVDIILVNQGLVEDIDKARRLVMAGKVLLEGQLIMQASQLVSQEQKLTLVESPQFVSRGGEKLQAAFEGFPLSVKGKICADVGASTGGFSDCLLKNGAEKVFAIDVGYGILDWRLRNDPRVVSMERTNARTLKNLPESIGFLTADVSFISLKRILPAAVRWFSSEGGQALVLIKPQFEATKVEAAKGSGVIRDPVIHRRILMDILLFAGEHQYQTLGIIRSPLQGPAGNVEFLAWLNYPGDLNKDELEVDFISPLFENGIGK